MIYGRKEQVLAGIISGAKQEYFQGLSGKVRTASSPSRRRVNIGTEKITQEKSPGERLNSNIEADE